MRDSKAANSSSAGGLCLSWRVRPSSGESPQWVKSDNRIENLEWCTISENVRHAIETGLRVYGTGLQSRTHKGWVQAERGGFGLMLRGHRDLIAIGMNLLLSHPA